MIGQSRTARHARLVAAAPVHRSRGRRWLVAAALAEALAATLVTGLPASAAPPALNPPPRPALGPTATAHPVPARFSTAADQPSQAYRPTATAFPAAVTGLIDLGGATGRDTRRAAGTAVWAQPVTDQRGRTLGPAQLRVRLLDHAAAQAAGVSGVLLTVGPADHGAGPVRVGVDYGSFAQAYGGNFGARLRLLVLPPCALTTPRLPACRRGVPLPSANRPATRQVSAPITLAPGSSAVLAATADPGPDGAAGGTYAATTLKPSGSWTVGGNSGSFTYTYPITVPPAVSSLAPALALSYSSGGVDGQTASTEAQASWVGDGWSTPHSYVEQSFVSCADSPEGSASPVSTGDMCYDGPILTLSLNGSTTSLVWDATRQVWKPQRDNGEVVTHVVNSGNGSGTYNTDYWTVTDRSGTVYQFGRNQLPGWTSGKPTTNSVDSEPVYSAHPGDPCNRSAGFTASVCTMAYRWNLDYVVDAHRNAMSYYYLQDTNYYGQDNGAQSAGYIRDGHLDHIDYGFSDPNPYGTAPDRIQFTVGNRCLSGTCTPLSTSTKANWPDVPYDLACTRNTTCTSQAPSFFSTVRLTSIATQQYSTASSSYLTVDSYALSQSIPATGDGTSPTLWLDSVVRTGSSTGGGAPDGPITVPPVVFGKIQLQNRVDNLTDGLPAFYRYRIASITTETGSVISPTYQLVNPCSAPVTTNPASNTSSCYPVYWTPAGYTARFLDWFNKYLVTRVTATDPTGGAPATATRYVYQGGAAWHYDDNEVVKAKYRSYGQFRGYGDVQVLTGDGVNDPQMLTETTYYRGMSQNNNTTTVTLPDSAGGQHLDAPQLDGNTLETTAHLGNDGPADHSTITSYWVSAATGTRNRTGLPALTANWVAPIETYTRQAVTSGAGTIWRYTEIDSTYNAGTGDATIGLPTASYTHTVPASPAYDRCTTTAYAPANAERNLVGLITETETDSVACGGFTEGGSPSVPAAPNTLTAPSTVDRPARVASDTRTFYDDPTFATAFPQPAAPTRGEVTMVRQATGWVGGVFTYQTTKRAAYDPYGRAVTSYDGNGNRTSTAYTMNAVGLTTAVTVTNPLNQTSSTALDPQRGLPLTATDLNGITATQQYDPLGRLRSVWADSRPTSTPANVTFAYHLSNTGPTTVTTGRLNDEGGSQTSTTIYDAQLRPRQTQASTPQSGRLVTDTFYDSRGLVRAKYNGWWDATTLPNTTLVAPSGIIPDQHFYTYDGLGRAVVDTSADSGVTIAATTTVYNGDRTTTIPPTGGITQTTITDPLGRTSELDQYSGPPTVTRPADPFTGVWSVTGGSTIATTYGYDGHGNQSAVTDAAGNTWTTSFDLRGQATSRTDPDTGTTTLVLDGNGNPVQSTDSRGRTTSTTYDPLNRKTGLYAAPPTAQTPTNRLATWVYDNTDNAVAGMKYPLGHLTTQTAYWNGAAYVRQQTGFTVSGASLGERITIPPAEGALAGTYAFGHTYTATTGLPLKDDYPASGGLPAETVLHGYATALDLPDTLGGLTGYADTTSYDAFGRVTQLTLNAAPSHAYLTNTWDRHNSRLTGRLLTRAVATPSTVDNETYSYDPAGNLLRQTSTRLDASTPTETQCQRYDQLGRLTTAWTATDDCAATPTTATHTTIGDPLGSASTYWTTWAFDPQGDRTSQTRHAIGTDADTTTTYTYGTTQPHTLTGTASTGAAAETTSYQYDPAGNMTSRNAGQGSQTLTWDDAGRLTTITGNTTGASGFVYDADGSLLLQKDPDTTTLYLPGEQLTLNTRTGTRSGTRYYPLPGGGTAIRTGATTIQFQLADQHDTPTLYLDNTAQNPTWRQTTPYGAPRGTTTASPDNHGFLNKPHNPTTGLTEIGARQYDPTTGRFISRDPILEKDDPQQLNGYTYATNNPTTHADPTGLCRDDPGTPCGDGHFHDGNGLDGPPANTPSHHCSITVCGPAGPPTSSSDCPLTILNGCHGDRWTPPNAPRPTCATAWVNGQCLPKDSPQLRDGNLKNGSDAMAMNSVAQSQIGYCRLDAHQIVCFNVSQVYLENGPNIDIPGDRAMTIGDVLLWPGDESSFDDSLGKGRQKKQNIENAHGSAVADEYGPDLERHEAVHSEQWARYSSASAFLADYALQSTYSAMVTGGDPSYLNNFEREANLYWGGYLVYPT